MLVTSYKLVLGARWYTRVLYMVLYPVPCCVYDVQLQVRVIPPSPRDPGSGSWDNVFNVIRLPSMSSADMTASLCRHRTGGSGPARHRADPQDLLATPPTCGIKPCPALGTCQLVPAST